MVRIIIPSIIFLSCSITQVMADKLGVVDAPCAAAAKALHTDFSAAETNIKALDEAAKGTSREADLKQVLVDFHKLDLSKILELTEGKEIKFDPSVAQEQASARSGVVAAISKIKEIAGSKGEEAIVTKAKEAESALDKAGSGAGALIMSCKAAFTPS